MEFRTGGKTVAVVALVLALSACQPETSSVAPQATTTTTTATTSAVAIPTDLVGKAVPAAKDELAKLGFRNVDVVSVDGRMVIVEANWPVVSVDGAGSATPTSAKITIHVAKPTATPTPAPTTTEAAPPPPQTTVQPPAYTPPPADPGPSEVYYKNCADARARGAAPLHRGDPGYRSALDRDGDGIACE